MALLQSGFIPSTTLSYSFPAKPPSTKSNPNFLLKPKILAATARNVGLADETVANPDTHFTSIPKSKAKLNLRVKTKNGVEEYLSLLSRCNVQRTTHVLDSKKIHAQVVKSGLQLNKLVGNKLAISYSKNLASLDDARRLFDEISERTVPAYAVLIGSYCRSQLWEDVISLSGLMIHQGLLLDQFLIPTVLKACSALEMLRFGRMVHGYALRNKLQLDVFVGNALIDMYANCGDLNCSRRTFDLMPERDVVSWTALVSAYMGAGNLDEARELFNSMQLNGVKPDVISWNALVSGTAHNGEIDEALCLLGKMREIGFKPGASSWNGIISGCVENEFFEEAFDVFSQMLTSFENPNAVTFVCILPAIGALGNKRLGQGMHAYALKRDLLYNIYVGGSLIDMYSKCGRRNLAERVFMEMEIKNTVVVNEMIMAYVSEGNMMEASLLLNSMLSDGLKPDVITYNTLLAGFSRKGQKEEAFRLLSDMVRMGLKPNVVSMNVLISGFQQSGLSGEALKLFRTVQSPSEVEMLMGGSKARGFFSNKLSSLSIRPNSVTSTSALAACADLNSLCKGKEIHGYILRNGLEPNIFISSALVDMYAKCHNMHSAVKVFNRIHDKNIVSWNTLMAGLINNSEADEALKLFPKMLGDGLHPSSITFTILLSACCYVASLRLGRALHGYILKSEFGESTAALSSALVDMYMKCGNIIKGRLVFDCEAQKDLVLWNAMIAGYSIHGMAKDAIDLFEQLEPSGMKPNHNTFAALLSACIREGMLEQGWKYFNYMDTFGIKPNMEHYTCMVGIMGSAGLLGEALDFIERMPLVPDPCIWTTLLRVCSIHSYPEIGERAVKALFELEPSNASNYIFISNTYAMDGTWVSASNFKSLTRGRRLVSIKECSSIDDGNMIHTFKGGESSHPKFKEITEMWDRLASEMGHVKYLPLDPVLKDEGGLNHFTCLHTEKLATCFGLITLNANSPIRVSKNLWMCTDCHTSVKHISKIDGREIFVKDGGFYHHFKEGVCSCKDRW